jgi:hypothetical protein
MNFLISVTVLLVLALVSVSRVLHVEITGEEINVNRECSVAVLPDFLYHKAAFLTACVLVMLTTIFFLLPVL